MWAHPGQLCDWVCVYVWKAAGLGGGCGGLPAVRGGFQPDTAGFSRLQRGGVHLYGGLCWAANSLWKVKPETTSTERRMLYFNHVDGGARLCWIYSTTPVQQKIVNISTADVSIYILKRYRETLWSLYRNSSVLRSGGKFEGKINITMNLVRLA